MNFIFSVYSVKYGYQSEFLDICLLLDIYITTICLIFQFKYLHSSYSYFCGCIDIVCRYYCNQFVNPSHLNHHLNNHNYSLQPISATNPSQLPRVSIELRPPNNGQQPLNNSQKDKDAVFSESEPSPSNDIHHMLNTPIIDDSQQINDDHHESASYDITKKTDFEDLPSLPMAESRDKSTNDIKSMLENKSNKLYIVNNRIPQYKEKSDNNNDHLSVPSHSSKQQNNNINNPHIWNFYFGFDSRMRKFFLSDKSER